MTLIKTGNLKIDKSVGILCMPTTACPIQCANCYARRPEKFRPNVLPSRMKKYTLFMANRPAWIATMIYEIRKAKIHTFRFHESGDFFSQSYVNAWIQIARALPAVEFYGYTKTFHLFDFSELAALPNVNLINSLTPYGVNFGDDDHVARLVADGYSLCPCTTPEGKNIKCGRECTICHTEGKVCFRQH